MVLEHAIFRRMHEKAADQFSVASRLHGARRNDSESSPNFNVGHQQRWDGAGPPRGLRQPGDHWIGRIGLPRNGPRWQPGRYGLHRPSLGKRLVYVFEAVSYTHLDVYKRQLLVMTLMVELKMKIENVRQHQRLILFIIMTNFFIVVWKNKKFIELKCLSIVKNR